MNTMVRPEKRNSKTDSNVENGSDGYGLYKCRCQSESAGSGTDGSSGADFADTDDTARTGPRDFRFTGPDGD